ncbi:hypothetical protein BDR06DRAFT_1006281 [Suillus hirtellus]|nr:hypothetical protein BDR06DRAFT_1006281 [Suillus hirtellus]
MPLVPTNQKQELADDSASDFGIKIPDDLFQEATSTIHNVSPDSPMYPFLSKAHFITSLLFSSPCLPFSEPQKKAILNWAEELGTQNLPTLGAIKSFT